MERRIDVLAESSLPQAADLWCAGWREAHADILPPQLVRLRTPASFRQRLRDNIAGSRVAMRRDQVLGLCIVRQDELYQMYVAPEARGTGTAQHLMQDAETRILAAGHESAWLACAIDNARAARFYERAGWTDGGERVVGLDTSDGEFRLNCRIFQKHLRAQG